MSRRSGARVVAAVAAGWWAIPFFGLIDLAVPFVGGAEFYDGYLLETGWGLLYTVLVAAPLLALAARPEAGAPALQLTVVAAAVAITAVVTPAPRQLLPACGVLGCAVAVRLAATGRIGLHRLPPLAAWSGRTPLLVMAGAAAVPAVVLAADWVEAARRERHPVDITNGLDHWPMQAALVVAVVAVAVVAAGRPLDGRVPVWCAGASAAWLGAMSIAYPDHAGSLGRGLGVAAALWGTAFVAVGELGAARAHRAAARPRRPASQRSRSRRAG